MPGFLVHLGAQVLCAHARPTGHDCRGPLCHRWLRIAAAARRERTVHNGAVRDKCHTRVGEGSAGAAARQPGDLRTDWNSLADRGNADARDRDVR